MLSEATITSEGQVTIPADILERLGLEAGRKLVFKIREDGGLDVRVRKMRVGAGLGVLKDLGVSLPEGDLSEFIDEAIGAAMREKYEGER